MTEIIPAIMPKSFEEVDVFAKKLTGLVDVIQLDIMDGVFVPEKTWPYSSDEELAIFVKKTKNLPLLKEINYEIDLMVADPVGIFKKWSEVGAKRIIIHIESVKNIEEFFTLPFFNKNHESFLEIGIAINIDTDTEVLCPHMDKIDFIQYMGIAKIGYQGFPFDERVIDKIQNLRENYPDIIISIDGGVSFETAPQIVLAGVNRMVSGSTILNSEDKKETIKKLRNS